MIDPDSSPSDGGMLDCNLASAYGFKDDILDYLSQEDTILSDFFMVSTNNNSEESSGPSALGLEGMEKVASEKGDLYRFPVRQEDKVVAEMMQGSHGYMVEHAGNGEPVCVVDTRCAECKGIHSNMTICPGCQHVSFCSLACLLKSRHWCRLFAKEREEYEKKVDHCVELRIGLTVLHNFDVVW